MRTHRLIRSRLGFTLTEMMVSLALVAIIMGASTSLVVVAARALASDQSSAGVDAVTARAATSAVIEDLKVATQIVERTSRSMSMIVPDRNGDGAADTIRYSWSGTRGDPLVRAMNGGTPGIVAANVQSLNFAFLSKTVGRPPPVTSAEQLVAAYAPDENISNGQTFSISSTAQAAGQFRPVLPETCIAWKLNRCEVVLQKKGLLAATATVSLKYADSNGKPTGAVLASGSVALLQILGNSPVWCAINLSPAVELDPTRAVCLIVAADTSEVGGYIYIDNSPTAHASSYMTSADGGVTWTSPTINPLLYFRAHGTITTQERETLDFQPLPSSPQ
jgi:prepilin-type N-terminal cleavage/methylation domain-containing protein